MTNTPSSVSPLPLPRELERTLEVFAHDEARAITPSELTTLLETYTLAELLEASHRLTQRCASQTFNTCTIINAKADGCSCDCAWCAQSRHWNPAPAETRLVDESIALAGAERTLAYGIGRYSLVTAGRKLSPRTTREASALLQTLREKTPALELCASFGLMNEAELRQLKAAGLVRYHCNLETSDEHFKRVCTTHTREDKIATLEAARRAGLELCSGGLFGIGETEDDRIELALTLRRLGIPSIPLNFLSPIEGTPLAHQAPLTDEAVLRTAIIFRFANPSAYLRLAGGRAQLSPNVTEQLMYAGVNSAILGDFLTTVGSSVAGDLATAQHVGYELEQATQAALERGLPTESTTPGTSCRPTCVPNTSRAATIRIVPIEQIEMTN